MSINEYDEVVAEDIALRRQFEEAKAQLELTHGALDEANLHGARLETALRAAKMMTAPDIKSCNSVHAIIDAVLAATGPTVSDIHAQPTSRREWYQHGHEDGVRESRARIAELEALLIRSSAFVGKYRENTDANVLRGEIDAALSPAPAQLATKDEIEGSCEKCSHELANHCNTGCVVLGCRCLETIGKPPAGFDEIKRKAAPAQPATAAMTLRTEIEEGTGALLIHRVDAPLSHLCPACKEPCVCDTGNDETPRQGGRVCEHECAESVISSNRETAMEELRAAALEEIASNIHIGSQRFKRIRAALERLAALDAARSKEGK